MWITVAVLIILTSLLVETNAQSGFCTREISGLPVVDMCQSGSWTLGRVFLSVNSSSTGDNSRCDCTLRGKTPSQNTATTVTLWQQGSAPFECFNHHLVIVTWPVVFEIGGGGSTNFTCITPQRQAVTTTAYTQPVTLTQLRSDVSTILGFCLYLQPEDHASNNLELTCQGTLTSTSPTTASSFSSTSSPTSPTSPGSSSTSQSSPETSTSPSVPGMTSSASSDVTTPSAGATAGVKNSSPQTSDPFPTGAVAGGVVGGVVLIAIIVVIIVVCTRRKREPKPPSEERSGAVNRGYENVLTDNILYESSSGLANNQSPPSSQPTMSNGEGAYQSLDENGKSPSVTYYNTSGGLATVSTGNERERPIFGATNDYASVDEVTPRTSGAEPKRTSASPPAATPAPAAPAAAAPAAAAPSSAPPAPAPKPPTDQYAVVSKPPRQNKPAQNAEARSQSTNVTLPSGDVYAVVDRSRNRGSEPTSPRSPPPEVAPPPAPVPDTTPGLVYADLDLVPSPRSSVESSAPPTDYAEIDHEASARL